MADGLIKSSRKTPTKFDNGYEPTFDSDGTPTCLGWKIEDVADWVEFLGFPQYRVRQKLQSSALRVLEKTSFALFFSDLSFFKAHFNLKY